MLLCVFALELSDNRRRKGVGRRAPASASWRSPPSDGGVNVEERLGLVSPRPRSIEQTFEPKEKSHGSFPRLTGTKLQPGLRSQNGFLFVTFLGQDGSKQTASVHTRYTGLICLHKRPLPSVTTQTGRGQDDGQLGAPLEIKPLRSALEGKTDVGGWNKVKDDKLPNKKTFKHIDYQDVRCS